MTASDLSTQAMPALQWFITRFEGQALQLCWSWPQAPLQVDLGSILESLDLPLQPHEQERLVRFHREQGPQMLSLAMEHSCTQLRCSLNGQALAAGEWVYLHRGDVLEVGLCRLELDQAAPVHRPREPLEDVDLTQLAPADSSRASVDKMLTPSDAFDDLLAATPWQSLQAQGMQPERAAGVALDAKPRSQPLPMPGADSAVSGHSSESSQALSDGLMVPEHDDLLRQWHTQFLRRLQSPHDSLPQVKWVGVTRQHQGHQGDVWGRLLQDNANPDLSALLGQDAHISNVLAQLDDHGHSDWLDPPASVNVMHLFAPEGWTPAEASAQVPLLTRQEHHGMALDSALPLSDTTTRPSGKQDS